MKKLLLLLLLSVAVIATSFTSFAQVGIGTPTPNAAAALEITSTTQGFLPPRMTKVQLEAIANPVEGLMVYCIDCVPKTLYIFDGRYFLSSSNNTPIVPDVYSTTGKTWMDRNLGATQVATSSTDADSYGDLYQWGKAQAFTSAYNTANNIAGPVDDTAAAGTSFITNNGDWLSTVTTDQTTNNARWNSGSEGTPVKVVANDPCPSGFRVPTLTELQAERDNGGTGYWGTGSEQNNAAGAFASVLKLPLAGRRISSNGTLSSVGSFGYYWSSTVSGSNARRLLLGGANANTDANPRANGFSVRCIKD